MDSLRRTWSAVDRPTRFCHPIVWLEGDIFDSEAVVMRKIAVVLDTAESGFKFLPA